MLWFCYRLELFTARADLAAAVALAQAQIARREEAAKQSKDSVMSDYEVFLSHLVAIV